MVNVAPPSRNPANSMGDMPGAMREILGKFLRTSIDDMLPAKIVAYDRETNRATIQPLIAMVTTDKGVVSRNQLASIPVLNIGGGGFILSFNLRPGDLGWMKACDRDIASFLKSYSEAEPTTKRVHDFNNSVFIPDVMTGYQIAGEDEENAVFQTLDGTVRVSLFPDKVKITAPLIVCDTPLTQFTGDIEVLGDSILSSNVTSNGVNISDTHTHTGSATAPTGGISNTGVPN